MRKIIDLETHFYTPAAIEYLKSRIDYPKLKLAGEEGSYNLCFTDSIKLPHGKVLLDKLLNLSNERIKVMDNANVSIQVLSLSEPGGTECADNDLATELAKKTNDELHQAILRSNGRLKGFATLNPHDPISSCKELERCITELGFSGWLTHSNYGDNIYLDNHKFLPLLKTAEKLNCPIYLHPSAALTANFAEHGFATAGAGLGFQFDTALCFMRMVCAGIFDQCPNLKIILGHMGETLPFLMERLDFLNVHPQFSSIAPNIRRLPSQVLKENTYVTTSGRFFEPVLKLVIEVMGEDRVLFASDYPMENLNDAVFFIENAQISEMIKDKVFHKNAEKLGF